MKIMAIDYGDAHTGIAISDYTETLAGHSEVIHSRKQEEVLAAIRRIIAEHGVKLLVLGYPRNMDGTEGPRAEKCAAFGALLRKKKRGKGRKSVQFSAKTCKKCLTAGHIVWYHLTYL